MHRSSSTSRASDEFAVSLLPPAPALGYANGACSSSSEDLPRYNPVSDASKKEKGLHQKTMAEKSIHLIPLILILCGLILWFFSDTVG